jgi:hypothetical protein
MNPCPSRARTATKTSSRRREPNGSAPRRARRCTGPQPTRAHANQPHTTGSRHPRHKPPTAAASTGGHGTVSSPPPSARHAQAADGYSLRQTHKPITSSPEHSAGRARRATCVHSARPANLRGSSLGGPGHRSPPRCTEAAGEADGACRSRKGTAVARTPPDNISHTAFCSAAHRQDPASE